MSPWVNHVWQPAEDYPSTDARARGLVCIRGYALVRHGCGWFIVAGRGQLTATCRCGRRAWLSELDVWATSDTREKLRGLITFYRGWQGSGDPRAGLPAGDIDAKPVVLLYSHRNRRKGQSGAISAAKAPGNPLPGA